MWKGRKGETEVQGIYDVTSMLAEGAHDNVPNACHVEILNRDERSFKPGSKVKQVGELTI